MNRLTRAMQIAALGLIMLATNSDPYGQKSLVSRLPWGPDARDRKRRRP